MKIFLLISIVTSATLLILLRWRPRQLYGLFVSWCFEPSQYNFKGTLTKTTNQRSSKNLNFEFLWASFQCIDIKNKMKFVSLPRVNRPPLTDWWQPECLRNRPLVSCLTFIFFFPQWSGDPDWLTHIVHWIFFSFFFFSFFFSSSKDVGAIFFKPGMENMPLSFLNAVMPSFAWPNWVQFVIYSDCQSEELLKIILTSNGWLSVLNILEELLKTDSPFQTNNWTGKNFRNRSCLSATTHICHNISVVDKSSVCLRDR